MESHNDMSAPLWDVSQLSLFSPLREDDYLTLLPTQYTAEPFNRPSGNDAIDNPSAQNGSLYSLPSLTSSDDDSNASSPNGRDHTNDDSDAALKRKASDGQFDAGPSQKSQHTMDDKKTSSGSARRKSTGSTQNKDEFRLQKRKEQNRAAQRAFRERKEKHVKDLEDKVAALEARNEQTSHENENLRDLLSRLRSENVMLKQASFTFSVPKQPLGSGDRSGEARSFNSEAPLFTPQPIATEPKTPSLPPPVIASPRTINPLDWSSLSSFDPSMLDLLDETPEITGTGDALPINLDFGVAGTEVASHTPYTTIASNPMFMSLASSFDMRSSPSTTPGANTLHQMSPAYSFDMSSPWGSTNRHNSTSVDDLFNGYMNATNLPYPPFAREPPIPSTESPSGAYNTSENREGGSTATSSSASTPSSAFHDVHFDYNNLEPVSDGSHCPKTRAEMKKVIEDRGLSTFAPPSIGTGNVHLSGSVVNCAGSSFPKTQESVENVEFLTAWRSITNNPQYQDLDVSELCREFTKKAKCDGKKVVLEPQGVNSILQTLSKARGSALNLVP